MDSSANGLRSLQEESNRILILGNSETNGSDNSVCTSKYSILTFFPKALREQFRRVGNVYFLTIGVIMFIGQYTDAWNSSISPWTTLGPLGIVISVSLLQEGYADVARHRNDKKTNTHPCILLKCAEDLDKSDKKRVRDESVFNGKDIEISLDIHQRSEDESNLPLPKAYTTSVSIDVKNEKTKTVKLAFERVQRKDIYAGDIVLMKSRDMVPADIILLATSNQGGSAYIETSSIDGETNLKLRSSPQIPNDELNLLQQTETLEQAAKRLAGLTLLGYPSGVNAAENPLNNYRETEVEREESYRRISSKSSTFKGMFASSKRSMAYGGSINRKKSKDVDTETYVASLLSEPPNPNVNNYTGKLTLPPGKDGDPSITLPLNNENILLRGAVLRNTEWAVGVACFTGDDTKLVLNSFTTPSKFSNLDVLMNKTIYVILFVMLICILLLAAGAVVTNDDRFDTYWIFGINNNTTQAWPYLPGLPPPEWETGTENFVQQMFLFITLLNNFVPLSLYVTVEIVTFCMMYFINSDRDMYHAKTDTPASAKSTIVTDLGRVSYIFSDKTGTLTRNVMRFKRCSVDGLAFGAPIEKKSPKATQEKEEEKSKEGDGNISSEAFHPLKQLLVGTVSIPSLETREAESNVEVILPGEKTLTFNAEMFLRVMSLCHTVVVEKEHDPNSIGNNESETKSKTTKSALKYFRKKKPNVGASKSHQFTDEPHDAPSESPSTISFGTDFQEDENDDASLKFSSEGDAETRETGMGPDGAPPGHVYEAESPDEGALVSGASLTYGFQFVGRDASGMLLKCLSPSLLKDEGIVDMLKGGKLTANSLACKTALPIPSSEENPANEESDGVVPRYERWKVLAINKFDSDRKRMSVLVRSPPELGSLPLLLCKGADSSMLDPNVCTGGKHLVHSDNSEGKMDRKSILGIVNEEGEELNESSDNWEMSTLLGIQAHLGDFASEGLRTLVLGVRFLSEEECASWLNKYNLASSSIKDRDQMLTDVALEIERDLHIVGATAIEDKLQKGVPETIHILEQAGIKLWVLTGDKRETAIEIGYSTKVLTPKMHVTEVADVPAEKVKTLVAMEFLRLVKQGKLLDYQKSSLILEGSPGIVKTCTKHLGRFWRRISRSTRLFFYSQVKPFFRKYIFCCFFDSEKSIYDDDAIRRIQERGTNEDRIMDPVVRRRNVRERAEKIIADYLKSPDGELERLKKQARETSGKQVIGLSHNTSQHLVLRSDSFDDEDTDRPPDVFERATSAKAAMEDLQSGTSVMSSSKLRQIAIASMTSHQRSMSLGSLPIVDEETLSIESFVPGGKKGDISSSFDKKKRTVLEKVFATDKDTRHGKLNKHVKAEIKSQLSSAKANHDNKKDDLKAHAYQQRALVIEGAALRHLLGDEVLEEMIFAVASGCDSVIACRVSPKQKALLVRLVRNYVNPTPVTLAIGDGANDVGMIQEAHVGVGISGLEGQQAVNSSDFAIAQFRYLEELVLIHGRWNFIRMSKVILFSFYKNAVFAALLIVYQFFALFSGVFLFDQWVAAGFNFFVFLPILFFGIFDRDLDKEYVRRNPEVYASSRRNEHLTLRFIIRWVTLVVIHTLIIFFLNYLPLKNEGGYTSAFDGLMSGVSRNQPGDGEGPDYDTFGLTIYNSVIVTMTYKALYETRSVIIGWFPAFTCRKGVGEGYVNRLAYTWVGAAYGQLGFYIFFIYVYQFFGLAGPESTGSFFPFVFVTNHVLNKRSITWMLFLLVPIAAALCDVAGKVIGNLFYPAQVQIHMEIASQEIAHSKEKKKETAEKVN
mmetsp:Transcript_23218/g.33776  ORF Transcript_23218/g.33776 Transcript_23218/m.33776 type:complete len:1789 (+) Transcript_23218:129-5495(+)